jgi:peroxiredoxin
LGRHYDVFKKQNFVVLVILGDTVKQADRYCESLHLPYTVLSDPDRAIYHQYGLQRSFFLQRTASVIVDCSGIVRYIKTSTSPMLWLQETREVLDFINSLPVDCQPADTPG